MSTRRPSVSSTPPLRVALRLREPTKTQLSQTFAYSAKVTGESVTENGVTTNVWYHSTAGNYLWSGDCEDI